MKRVFQAALVLSLLIVGAQTNKEYLTDTSAPVEEVAPSAAAVFTEIVDTNDILKDADARISKQFHIPKSLRWRTSFWFDIYTRYTSKMKVVHHKRYPWIIYDVIDTTSIFNGKGHLYTKIRKANTHIYNEHRKTTRALKKLASRRSYRNLKGRELKIYRLLKQVPGKRRNVIRQAARSLRIQTGQRDHFMAGLVRSTRYLPAMEAHFTEQGLPLELTRLPLVESSFNKKAISKVGASGVWQIMPSIGRKLMKVSRHVDERNSPLKATYAAATLFKEKYRSLKDWSFAVLAYNTGPYEVKKAARRLRTKHISTIIGKHKSRIFKFASRNFYPSFLAALHAEKYQREIFGELKSLEPVRYDIYNLEEAPRLRVGKLMELSGTSKEEFLALNFDLRKALRWNTRLPKNHKLYLPEGKALILDRNLKKLEDDLRIRKAPKLSVLEKRSKGA